MIASIGHFIASIASGLLSDISEEIKVAPKSPIKIIIGISIFVVAPLRGNLNLDEALSEPTFIILIGMLLAAGAYDRFMDKQTGR